MTIATNARQTVPREIKPIIWAFPAIFFIHALEEVLAYQRFVTSEHARRVLPSFAFFRRPTFIDIALAEGLIFLGVLAVSAFAARSASPHRASETTIAIYAYMFAIAMLLVNVVSHIAQAVAFLAYIPGLNTSIVVNLPYSFLAIGRLFASRLLTRRIFVIMLLAAALFHTPIATPLAVLASLIHYVIG